MNGIVFNHSIRIAGNEMDEAIVQYLKKKYNLLIGERSAELVKIQIGSAYPLDEPLTMEIKGRDLRDGIPKTIVVDDQEMREALEDVVGAIINALRIALEKTPPELAADIIDRGIILTGGGALLKNLDRRIREETQLPVFITEDPLTTVVLGAGKMLDNLDLLRKVSLI
jgi:rod shape-determining protein MreB and related proteins